MLHVYVHVTVMVQACAFVYICMRDVGVYVIVFVTAVCALSRCRRVRTCVYVRVCVRACMYVCNVGMHVMCTSL